jgi:hypothetical protein
MFRLMLLMLLVCLVISWPTTKNIFKKWGKKEEEEVFLIKKQKTASWPLLQIRYDNWKDDIQEKFDKPYKTDEPDTTEEDFHDDNEDIHFDSNDDEHL